MSETEEKPAEEQQPPPPAEPSPETPQETQPEAPIDRRFSRLTSRLSNVARERDELAAKLQALQAQQAQVPLTPDQSVQAHIQAEAARLQQKEAMEARSRAFHQAGEEAYEDWGQRCRDLMAMGADPQIAEMLIELPKGHVVAAALAREPEEIEKIAAYRTPNSRALALGRYAERLEARPLRQVSNAPKPPTPVTQRSKPQFDEYNADAQTLTAYYMRQAMERRAKGGNT